jgi:tetratricopeptide (TPR) repeat protein
VKQLLVLLLLVAIIAGLAHLVDTRKSPHELIGELMYFPSGTALHAVSMGFYAPLSDLVWLRFIQYYGEHRMTDVKFEFLFHILDILTTLDSRFTYAYTLGALMLTHDAQRPDQARDLLKKGMRANPGDWRLPFIYGFINYAFLANYPVAHTYFRIASMKPGAPEMAKRWAAYVTYFKLGDLKSSLALWVDLYNNTENPEEKAIALYYIEKITMKLHIELLDSIITEFHKRFDRWPHDLRELVRTGLLESIPEEPHGEKYYIKEGETHSTWMDKIPPHMRR